MHIPDWSIELSDIPSLHISFGYLLMIFIKAILLKRRSDLLVDQLRAIDNRRLIDGPLARLSPPLVTLVDRAIGDVLDLHE
jgi:mRNA-degrading endonuclease toxin of MazEF toxin-antitoxin module